MNTLFVIVLAIFLVGLLIAALTVWALIDCLVSEFDDVAEKVLWLIAILAFPLVCPILYLVIGRSRKSTLGSKATSDLQSEIDLWREQQG